jgi:hypothetical protein
MQEDGNVEALKLEENAAAVMVDRVTSTLCERCVNDSAFQAGMVGAPRCVIIERALESLMSSSIPAEWRIAPGGEPRCSAFCPDIERDFHLAHCA